MFWKKYGKLLVLPAVGILGIGVGAVGGALAIDHLAATYLWPEPENLVVWHATPAPAAYDDVFIEEVTPRDAAAD